METKNKFFNKLTNLLFFFSILFFTIGLNLQDNPPSGWYQQFIPDVNNRPINDIEFLDSLIGFAVTGNSTVGDTNYIIKTTNGGNNWIINFSAYKDFARVIFINSNTGFVCGGLNTVNGVIYKTTNQGANWSQLNTPFGLEFKDMSVLNEDTIWVVDDHTLGGGVFRTTNGGQNWTQQFSGGSQNPDKIYMYNREMGFFSDGLTHQALYKTTNSGLNWNTVLGENGFLDMYFVDSLNGWKARGNMKMTTNAGMNWQTQTLPPVGGIVLSSLIDNFEVINNDSIWGVGAEAFFNPGQFRGLIYKTTNKGESWGYQLPDTSIHIVKYYQVDFVNKLCGWSYHPYSGVHTVTGGGDTTYYTGINQVSNEIPKGFKLYQNYPNPFNPITKIKFDISKSMDIKLIVYDILGKEVAVLANERLNSGSYEVNWNGTDYTSGVYFYSLKTKDFSETKKMLLIK